MPQPDWSAAIRQAQSPRAPALGQHEEKRREADAVAQPACPAAAPQTAGQEPGCRETATRLVSRPVQPAAAPHQLTLLLTQSQTCPT